ncbi:MAG: 4'-phosphopantetheinyl transferase superfamily protein [Bacteroidota bacterium]
MPFLREINPSNGITAGIWHITETSGELRSLVHLDKTEELLYASFSHELRKRHWLAYRVLLRELLAPHSSALYYDDHGKPCLTSGSHHISVSHAGDYAAAVYSEKFPVGIDIEQLKERIERVKERFMQEVELRSLSTQNRLEHLYVYWCGKEALYKLRGTPELDFRRDFHIHPFEYLCTTNQNCKATIGLNDIPQDYTLHYIKTGDYMLVVAY